MSTEPKDKPENGHIDHGEESKKDIDDISAKESQSAHIPYPKSVFFIISNEFCERFSFYGMRTILSLYLRDILKFTESDSTVIYHVFTSLAYFFPIFGAILSDSWIGKFKTILYVSLIYAAGNILLALTAASPLRIPQVPFTMVALLLIAVGTGGIKPCVSAFGGDQFVLPQQAIQLAAFFSVFYFSINAGSLISTFLTPVLREDVKCFGESSCYPLAFAVPGVLMIVSVVIFFLGMPLYKIKKPEGNIVVTVCKCIWHGAKTNFKSKKEVDHWLDHSHEKFGHTLVEDVKATLKVLVLFIPLPIFWALYDQQGSGWTFQAARMDGKMGSFTLLPDQMQVVNPFLILLFIPLFTYVVYPFFAKFNFLTSPLKRMACGGFLTAFAFGISAGISFALEATYPDLPHEGQCQLRVYNPSPDCAPSLYIADYQFQTILKPQSYQLVSFDPVKGKENVTYTISRCQTGTPPGSGEISIKEKTGIVYWTTEDQFLGAKDDIGKPEDGLPKVRTLVFNPTTTGPNLTYYDGSDVALSVNSTDGSLLTINPGSYKLGNTEVEFFLGGVYTVIVHLDDVQKVKEVKLFEITEPNSVHMLWLLPQYIVITAGEIMYSITGLEFSYAEAPIRMKSVLQAAWLLTSAFGNVIIVIIESAKIFDKKSYDFLLYAGLMVVDMFIFMLLAMRYKYVEKEQSNEDTEDVKSERRASVESIQKF